MEGGQTTLDFETYVPSQKELHESPVTGRRKWVTRIICPCFLFVRCTPKVRYLIKSRAPFILKFLKDRAQQPDAYGNTPFAQIPDDQMAQLMQMVGDADSPVTIDAAQLTVGTKVRVKTGRLKGFEGYLIREPQGKSNLAIRINVLGQAKTEMPAAMLEVIPE